MTTGWDQSLVEANMYAVYVATYFLERKDFVNCPSPYASKAVLKIPRSHTAFAKEEQRLCSLDKHNDPGFGKLKQAGSGGFATVYRTKLKSNKEIVAVKKIRCGSEGAYEDCVSELYVFFYYLSFSLRSNRILYIC